MLQKINELKAEQYIIIRNIQKMTYDNTKLITNIIKCLRRKCKNPQFFSHDIYFLYGIVVYFKFTQNEDFRIILFDI
jgi:hypothetical protein